MTKTEFNYVTYIKTTPQKVWDAITNPEFTHQYWSGMNNISDWKVGSKWEHVEVAGQTPRIIGEVLECTPPSRLVITWASPSDSADQSRVTFEIETVDDMVCLNVLHDKLTADSDMAKGISRGWPRVLSGLKTFLETGTVLTDWVKYKSCAA